MNLTHVFPGNSIKEKFQKEVIITHRGRDKLKEISKIKSSCMFEIGGGAWDKFVQTHPTCDRFALQEHFNSNNPRLYQNIERHIGKKVLHEILYTTAELQDEELDFKLVSELLLAVVYPKVLRISDVTFCNPYKKIDSDDKQYKFQEYKGLNLFSELIKNCELYCEINNISEICLSAAYIDIVPLFEKYGFSVEDTPAGRQFLELEFGIPMIKFIGKKA